jgi:cell division protein FtsW
MQRSVRRAATMVGGIDPWLTLAFLALICIGVLMVYSSSIAAAYAYYGSPYYVLQREIVWVTIGFIALAVTAHVDYHHWQRVALPFFAVSMVLLVVVLVPHIGHVSNGARRWFSLGAGVQVEPSEVVKLALIMYMASWLTSKGERVRDFQACFVPFSLIVGLVALLIVKQPDLGTAIVVTATMLAIFFVSGANLSHLLLVSGGASSFAWFLAHSSSYRYDRLTAFLNPWKDPTGVGYHIDQALLALGSGGIFGLGLGNSIQKNFLPAPDTDSILAIIGEEWGLIGTIAILLLFLVIAYRGVRIGLSAPDGFGRLLAIGISAWITLQALMNFAVITSSVPFTGVPLPFISYGGTSLIISMIAIGILLNVSRHTSGDAFARQSSHNGRGDGGPRVPRVIGNPVPERSVGSSRRNRKRDGQPSHAGRRRLAPGRARTAVESSASELGT